MNDAVYQKLVRTAKAQKTVSYSALGEAADLSISISDDLKKLGGWLDEIADHEVAHGRPLLPIVVVSEKTNMPGVGLFRYAKAKRLQRVDDVTFFAMELIRVYEFWKTAEPPAQ